MFFVVFFVLEIEYYKVRKIHDIIIISLDGPSKEIRGIIKIAPTAAPIRSTKYNLPISSEKTVKISIRDMPVKKKGIIKAITLIINGNKFVIGLKRFKKSILTTNVILKIKGRRNANAKVVNSIYFRAFLSFSNCLIDIKTPLIPVPNSARDIIKKPNEL